MENLYFDGQHYDCRYKNYKKDLIFWRALPIANSEKVLELCAGTGRLTSVLAKKAEKVIAIDNSSSMINQGRINCSKNKNITWIHSDLRAMKLNELFDHVVMGGLSLGGLEHNNFRNILRYLNSIMKPKSVFTFDGLTPLSMGKDSRDPRYRYSYTHPEVGKVNVFYKNELEKNSEKIQLFYTFGDELHIDEREIFYYTIEYLTKIIQENNFEIVTIKSDYEGTPFSDTSSQFIVSIKKKG